MTEVKPWEPVSYKWLLNIPTGHAAVDNIEWPWDWSGMDDEETVKSDLGDDAMLVYLANDQRIIVRALSEERKAARAMQKRVKKAVEANHRDSLLRISQNLDLARSTYESDDVRRATL